MSSMQQQRLLQALEFFNSRTKGAELPKGTLEAVQALQKILGEPMPERNNSPGARAALAVVKGARGTGEPMERAVRGIDGPSPGQRAAVLATQAPAPKGTAPNQE